MPGQSSGGYSPGLSRHPFCLGVVIRNPTTSSLARLGVQTDLPGYYLAPTYRLHRLAYRYTSISGTIGDTLKQDDGARTRRCSFLMSPYGSATLLNTRSVLLAGGGEYHNVDTTDGPCTCFVTPLLRSSSLPKRRLETACESGTRHQTPSILLSSVARQPVNPSYITQTRHGRQTNILRNY
ncbi:hypothetical protein BDV10DRAFT_141186 [Aspergillus recurvatus]